jgi:hypothetical protein
MPARDLASSSVPHEEPVANCRTASLAYHTATLAFLLERCVGIDDDGYLKMCPGNDGKSWYLCYRWRWGQWAGHYVMAVVLRGDLSHGLTLLTEKVLEVRRGVRRPTLDKYEKD